MKRCYGILAAVLLAAVAPSRASAADSPHDQTFSNGDCDNCHSLFTTAPSGKQDFSQGCIACHNQPTRLYPWAAGDQAVPGLVGDQHNWSGFAQNLTHGAASPSAAAVSQRLVDGKLQCAVCHDPHRSGRDLAPNSRHTTFPLGAPTAITGGPATSATMTLVSVGTTVKAFRVKIQSANGSGGSFVLSHDFGLATPTWFNWDGASWVAGTETGAGKPYVNNTPLTLDDPAVSVQFTAGALAGDYWDFSISYPFLRAGNIGDAFCYMCHGTRVMSALRVRGEEKYWTPNGTRKFSHPVNEGLNSNGRGYDQAAILDANGVVQTTGDGIASNDLKLDGGLVRCTTCHAVHDADSNSLTP